MLPVLSSVPVPAAFSDRVNSRSDPLVDFENGGAALGVGSDSRAFEWMATSDGANVHVGRDGVAPVLVLSDTGITEISLAFDQTMNTHIAYVAAGVSKWHYWDTLTNSYQTMTLTDCRTPRCCSDEKTPEFSGDRDIVLAYLREDKLYLRLQRDRFTVEYEKVPEEETHEPLTETTRLITVAMNTGRRLQWRFQ